MTKYKHHLLAVAFFILSIAAYAQPSNIALTIVQGKNEFKITRDTQTVKLERDKFKLVFNSLAYDERRQSATDIVAFLATSAAPTISSGKKISDLPYFQDGSGMACDLDKQYEYLSIEETGFDGFQYIIYNDTKPNVDRRAELESKSRDTLRLSWDIKKYQLYVDKKPMNKYDGGSFYLVVLNDFNMDGIVEEGEYAVVKVEFIDK